MSVFSRYSRVISPDGTDMSVSEALTQINAVLDEVLGEQEGDLDPDTRWCLTWFDAHGFTEGPYGEAETLASARNGAYMAIRERGPLFIIYPMARYPELRNQVYYNRTVWQVSSITLE